MFSLIASRWKAAVKKALDFANYVRRHCTSVILFDDWLRFFASPLTAAPKITQMALCFDQSCTCWT